MGTSANAAPAALEHPAVLSAVSFAWEATQGSTRVRLEPLAGSAFITSWWDLSLYTWLRTCPCCAAVGPGVWFNSAGVIYPKRCLHHKLVGSPCCRRFALLMGLHHSLVGPAFPMPREYDSSRGPAVFGTRLLWRLHLRWGYNHLGAGLGGAIAMITGCGFSWVLALGFRGRD